MALDLRQRQKKVERKKAKQKARRQDLKPFDRFDFRTRMQHIENVPFLHCCVRGDIWDQGVGNVIVSRQFPNGPVAVAGFLLDVFCLGVKDVFYNIMPRSAYEAKVYQKLFDGQPVLHMEPAEAKKLIEGAVQYAADLGIPPHADYAKGKLILADVDSSQCDTTFEYGRNGRPVFIQGPYDSPAYCEQIFRALAAADGRRAAARMSHSAPGLPAS